MNPKTLLTAWKTTPASSNTVFEHIGYSEKDAIIHTKSEIAVLGCCYETTHAGKNAGCVEVYKRLGVTWTREAQLVASNSHEDAFFGFSLVLSDDGHLLFVGALGGRPSIVPDRKSSGLVYVFQKTLAGWHEIAHLQPTLPEPGDGFGSALALNKAATRLLVGACRETVNHERGVGAAYVFELEKNKWLQKARIVPVAKTPVCYFGADVGMSSSGDYLAIQSENQGDDATASCLRAHAFVKERGTWVAKHASVS